MDPSQSSLAVLLSYPAAEDAVLATSRPSRSQSRRSCSLRTLASPSSGLATWLGGSTCRTSKTPGVRLRAIQSSSGSRAKSYALRFGAEYCTSDYDEILRNPDIQVVVIVSRNPQHAAQALAALRAGKHVPRCGKPMALTEQECSEISKAVRESGKQLTVGFNRSGMFPAISRMKQQISKRTAPASSELPH